MHTLTGLAVLTLTALLIASGNYRLAGFVFFGSILIALISRLFFVSMYLRGAAAERRDRATLVGDATIAAAIATDVLLLAIGMSVILANAQIGVLRTVKFVALSLVVTFLISMVRKSGMRRKLRGT
jgi:O-antigen ligase